MTLFQYALIVPKFEWSSFNYPYMIKTWNFAQMFLSVCNFLNEVVVYYLNWNEGVWSYPKLNEDVPLGPKLNGAIVVWPELI